MNSTSNLTSRPQSHRWSLVLLLIAFFAVFAAVQGPAPALASGCTSSAQCPTGQICCLACGYAGCERHACFATKICPHFP